MDWISLLLLSIGLSMDAMAVSVSCSISHKKIKLKHALRIATYFGGFQAGMPLIGFLAGSTFKNLIKSSDHWIAFGLLTLIGGKMLFESFKMEHESKKIDPKKHSVLLGLAIATSIDALAVGVGFALLDINIWLVISVIGSVTFFLSFLGTRIGKKLGHHFGSRIEFLGGLILIGIGIKILAQHLINHI